MLKKILFYCFLTTKITGQDFEKIHWVQSLSEYKIVLGKINGKDTLKIYKTGEKEQEIFSIENNTNIFKGDIYGKYNIRDYKMSWNKRYITISTFCDPLKGQGFNGDDFPQICEILRFDTDKKELIRIIGRKDEVNFENSEAFTPVQMVGINKAFVYQISHGFPMNNGDVMFYGSMGNQSGTIIHKRGIFLKKTSGTSLFQIETDIPSSFRDEEELIHPTNGVLTSVDEKNIFFISSQRGVQRVVKYSGINPNGKKEVIMDTRKSYNGEAIPVGIYLFQDFGSVNRIVVQNMTNSKASVSIDPFGEKILYSNIQLNSNGTLTAGNVIFNSNNGLAVVRNFANTNSFDQNHSIYVKTGDRYTRVLKTGDRISGQNIGQITDQIGLNNCSISFVSRNTDDKILTFNINIIDEIKIENNRVFIKGCFPDLNLERGLQVLLNGVVVVPEGTIPPSLRVNKNEISFNIPGNVSGKQKIDIILSTTNGPVGAVNNGIEFEFPIIPVELNLFGENRREIAPGEEINININSNVLGKFSIIAEDANGIRPVNIISSGNSRNLNISVKVLVNTKFTIKFISVNGEEKETSVFVEVMPPKISFLTSTREDQKIFSGDEIYVSGENLSPSGEEISGNNENLKVKINNIECEVIFVSPSVLQIKVPDFEVADEEENWLVISVFGRETAIKIKINKKEIENDPPMRK